MNWRNSIKYFCLYFIFTSTGVILVTNVAATVFGKTYIIPIGENGVYVGGSHCLINMEEDDTDEEELKLIFKKCLSTHTDFLYGDEQ